MARSNAVMKRTKVGDGMAAIITWAAIDGKRSVVCDCNKIPEPTRVALFEHGVYAKIGDAAAKSEATADEKFDAMEKVVESLYAGNWRGERESGDAALLEAICEFNPHEKREKHAADLKALTDAEKRVLRTMPPIKKILDSHAAAAVKKSGVDAAAILAKFIHNS